jgi:hypothetical protein
MQALLFIERIFVPQKHIFRKFSELLMKPTVSYSLTYLTLLTLFMLNHFPLCFS